MKNQENKLLIRYALATVVFIVIISTVLPYNLYFAFFLLGCAYWEFINNYVNNKVK